ncbi:hypothetical protein B6U99_04600 [Candidatus Geothermarchaeota archaeon ex4572_27]|nr:MAG: hypothetical protein B6U99_04600 [Candidatus Geothermarchaeota archaeon ex4572_27]
MTDRLSEAVKRYFLGRGLVEDGSPSGGANLSFRGPMGRVAVYVIDDQALRDRGEALRRVVRAASSQGYDLVYVAASKLVATVLDASALAEQGIGLLVVDGEVHEASPARRRPRAEGVEGLASRVRELEGRVEALERSPRAEAIAVRVERLEREVAELRANLEAGLRRLVSSLTSILDKIASLEGVLSELRAHTARAEATPIATPTMAAEATPSELPSYFKDNPWLRILSARGRE